MEEWLKSLALAGLGFSTSIKNIVDNAIRAPATPPAKAPATVRLKLFICSNHLITTPL